jgi:endonuclease III
LGGVGKAAAQAPADPADRITLLIQSILEEDAGCQRAAHAFAAIQKEFVDFNDLRVSSPKEIAEHLGRDYPSARLKAESLTRALDAIFDKTCTMAMSYMDKLTKRDLRRHLQEIGLSPYSAACVVLLAFGGHAVPVCRDLVECLEMDGYVPPGSDLGDVQGFLERIIAQKDALAAHEFFRHYLQKHQSVLADKRRKEAQARREAERKKAAAKAEAERKAAAEAARKAEKAAAKAAAEAARKPKKAAARPGEKAKKTAKGATASDRKKAPSPKAKGRTRK